MELSHQQQKTLLDNIKDGKLTHEQSVFIFVAVIAGLREGKLPEAIGQYGVDMIVSATAEWK